MVLQEAKIHLDSMDWHFAKSMPKIPHWYARKKEWVTPDNFTRAYSWISLTRFISRHGEKESFYKKTYSYLYHDGFKYWVMDENPDVAEIINRAKI